MFRHTLKTVFYRYVCLTTKRSITVTCINNSFSLELSYSKFTPSSLQAPKKPMVILHGLLGSKINWRSLAKTIASNCNCVVYTLDARNHGESPHSENFDYDIMAEDVKTFVEKEKLYKFVLMGHSMGGRTAMSVALSQPKIIEKLIIVDVSPHSMPEGSMIYNYMLTMKQVLNILPSNCSLTKGRAIASDYMASTVPELSTRFFLLNNLKLEEGKFFWKANIEVLERCFTSSIMKFSPPPGVYEGDTLFICGEKSKYVSSDDYPSIRQLFPKVEFMHIPDSGHWVHSERPVEFLAAVQSFCNK